VYAKYDVIGVYQWKNSKPLDTSYFNPGLLTTFTGCFCYYTTPSSLLIITGCTMRSNGICEYDNDKGSSKIIKVTLNYSYNYKNIKYGQNRRKKNLKIKKSKKIFIQENTDLTSGFLLNLK
ncbi:hypothetical protein BpHYR1_039280, partial [Brachionus plicatilis]